MITVCLNGGLGNQLFQIAYAFHLARSTNYSINVDLDSYKKNGLRSFSLSNYSFMSDCSIYESDKTIRHFKYYLFKLMYHFLQKVLKSIFKIDRHGHWFMKVLPKHGYVFNFDSFYYHYGKLSSDNYIYGYFQSEKYFIESALDIKSMFLDCGVTTVAEKRYSELMSNKYSIAISLRLGDDYYLCKDLNICDNDYYITALSKLFSFRGLNYQDVSVFIFSDVLERTEFIVKAFPLINFIHVKGIDAPRCLRLMSRCQDFVIPNSSYSWWGAYLSESENKLVVCPDAWFNSAPHSNDIYCCNMIKVSQL